MNPNGPRLLYLDGYTTPDPRRTASSSDAIGYGITASTVIRDGLEALGFELCRLGVAVSTTGLEDRAERLVWILSRYRNVLNALVEDPPDVIFSFHIFSTFPAEIRRMALDLGLSVPIVGYTHGSHWDPTDAFRFQVYPGMELLDLANLHVLDRILLASEYLRVTLLKNIGAFNMSLARQLDAKAVVVGLPLDVKRIDACRTDLRLPLTTVVFNHAPVSSKNPDLFARVLARLLPRHDVAVLFTRYFAPGQPGGEAILALAHGFPEQVILGGNMPLDEYYRALWAADLQVSTATHESLGVSTLEAMYTENCCILPRLGSYPEICNGNPNVLYELGEAQLEEKLCYYLENPDRRRAVAAELKCMAARYSPDKVVADIASAILGVVPAPPT
jgi:glycosyltransferase involved in cell wall biosynthesis